MPRNAGNGVAQGGRQATSPEQFNVKGKRIYMIGIGGCGMCGLARLMKGAGATVRGSDMSRSTFTDALVRDGYGVAFDQSGLGDGAIPEGTDLVVASAAIKPDHPQVLAAEQMNDGRGIPVLSYAEALGLCMRNHTGVCIAGTHGKSTTTAMLGTALANAGMDPSVIVGAVCSQLAESGGAAASGSGGGVGFRLGANAIPAGSMKGDAGLLVVEACEFNRSFHNYHPRLAVITSVEADHLDIYGSLEEVVKSFHDFAKLIPAKDDPRGGGTLLIAHDGAHRREVTAGLTCDVQTIGWSPSCDWFVQYEPVSRQTALIRKGEGLIAAWITPMPGEHNAMNAATACALATLLGADPDAIARNLSEFRGLERRMQLLGEKQVGRPSPLSPPAPGVRVYDDYGHHPTEVETTLRALRDFEKPQERGGRLICVFQPHQHSRTRFLLEEFASAFSAADVVIVPHIYFVRDSQEEKQKVTAADLVDRLRQRNVQAMHLYPFDAIVEQLEMMARPGDVVLVMGAGPVDTVGRGYLKHNAKR